MSNTSVNTVPPSKHIFLYELAKQPTGTKSRFLCCVVDYDIRRGYLLVEHAYPQNAYPIPRAQIDVKLVLETVDSASLRNGTWLNVIGTLKAPPAIMRKREKSQSDSSKHDANLVVQAVLIWDAGSFDIVAYQQAVERQRQARRDAAQSLKSLTETELGKKH